MVLRAVVFDAYGTLFDVAAAARRLEGRLDGKAERIAEIWRRKQLEYTWLRSLMGCFADFRQVTADGLDHALAVVDFKDPAQAIRTELLALYDRLDAYEEVADTLGALRKAGWKLAILSNGSVDMLAGAVENAGIGALLDTVLSVDALRIYKPHPDVYRLAVDALGVSAAEICFLSSNCWDAHGAGSFGFRTIWVNRFRAPPENLPSRPGQTIADLRPLPELLGKSADTV